MSFKGTADMKCTWCESPATGTAVLNGTRVPCCEWHSQYADNYVADNEVENLVLDAVFAPYLPDVSVFDGGATIGWGSEVDRIVANENWSHEWSSRSATSEQLFYFQGRWVTQDELNWQRGIDGIDGDALYLKRNN